MHVIAGMEVMGPVDESAIGGMQMKCLVKNILMFVMGYLKIGKEELLVWNAQQHM